MGDTPLDMGKWKGELCFRAWCCGWPGWFAARMAAAIGRWRCAAAPAACVLPRAAAQLHAKLRAGDRWRGPDCRGSPCVPAVFDWSMKFQDGSRPTDYASAEEMPADKREWCGAPRGWRHTHG